jgi:glycerol-3-phosphate O-acyltransferase
MKFYTSESPKIVSDFAKEFNFESLRPYYDSESREAMHRIAHYESYLKIMAYMWPEMTQEDAIQKALNVDSPYQFQTEFMRNAIWKIVKSSSTDLTWSGLEHLDKNTAYLYVANHRDILLDSAILQIILDKEGFETSEITFGSNLMAEGFITDFGRMNRMIPIKRDGNTKELYEISRQLSAYIRHTILDKKVSVWIAQRNGRTKDGKDMTQTGLLKMLNMSGTESLKENMKQLNIVPISISYEYEPCDHYKVQESFISMNEKYVKAPGEDLNSVLTGIKQPKGRIHLAFGKPINEEIDQISEGLNENEKIKCVTALIDRQIHQNYYINAVNYIAYDLSNQTNRFEEHYNASEKESFINYIDSKIVSLKGEPDILKKIFIALYANPVESTLL